MCILISLFLETARADGAELECESTRERDVCERGRERKREREREREKEASKKNNCDFLLKLEKNLCHHAQ